MKFEWEASAVGVNWRTCKFRGHRGRGHIRVWHHPSLNVNGQQTFIVQHGSYPHKRAWRVQDMLEVIAVVTEIQAGRIPEGAEPI